jgi:hypothetical protein
MTRILPTVLLTLLLAGTAGASSATAPGSAPPFKNSEWKVTVYYECTGDPVYSYWSIHDKHQFTSLEGTWPDQWEVDGSWQKGGRIVSLFLGSTEYSGKLKDQQTAMQGAVYYDDGHSGCWSAVRQ